MNQEETAKTVERIQNYIEENLDKPITLKMLSDEVGYSVWHTEKLFKDIMGRTCFEYIRLRRLTKAALTLRDQGGRVIDVALDYVFDSHEGFTRAFSRNFGITPTRYRRDTPPIPLYLPEGAYQSYLALHQKRREKTEMERSKCVFVQVIERPRRKCLLKRGNRATHYFEYCEETGCDVWGVLSSVKEALYEPIGMWLPESLIEPGTSLYVQGVELPLNYDKEIPEGFELIELEPCKMMIFQGEPYDDENFSEEVGEVMDYIDRFNPELYGYRWAKNAGPRFQLAPMGYRGYIEARPVEPING